MAIDLNSVSIGGLDAGWEGGSLVEVIFYGLCVIVLVYQGWKGWQMGVVRTGLRLAALVVSVLLGWQVGVMVTKVTGGIWAGVGVFAGGLAGLAVGLSAFVLLSLLAAFFFKKTGDNRSFLVRFLYGVGGVVFGLMIGGVYVLAAVSLVRAMGGVSVMGGEEGVLGQLQKSLEQGEVSGIVQLADPIPQRTYDLVTKAMRVATSPEAMAAFLETREMAPLIQNPKFQELISDMDIQSAAEQRNYLGILLHPKFWALMADEEFLRVLKSVDYEGALERALRYAEPVPSEIPQERFE